MKGAMIAATLLCAFACSILVLAEYKKWRLVRIAAKTIASLAFINVGVLAGAGTDFARWVWIGLVLGAVGDVALLGKGDRPFLVGLGAFLLGHLAYVVAAGTVVAPSAWLDAAGALAVVPTIVGAAALAWLWPRLGPMKLPVIAYVVTIILMVIGAVATRHDPFMLGAVLFFASDLAVARDKFVAAGFVNRAWGLPCYYAGQLLIAWSLA